MGCKTEGELSMVKMATDKYRNGIISLWQEAFGDTEAFINGFLDNMGYTENMLIYESNDDVLGMASMLPVFCGENKGRYIYAVATRKEHQGEGICQNIMKAVDQFIVRNNEKFAVLVPAGESLFGFYEKMGYNQKIYQPDLPQINEIGQRCSIFEYFKIRENLFKNYNLIGWSSKSLEYILSFGETHFCGNGAIYREGNEIKEALVPELFNSKWTKPFAEIKYYDKNLRFSKPYFGLCIN